MVAARESESRKTDAQASDLLLRAVALTTKSPTLENLQQQEKLFRELLLLDSNSVDAMAYLAVCLMYQRRAFINVLGPQVAEEKLKEGYSIALKAKELDSASALPYEALGYYFIYRRDLPQAIASFQKGIALNRNHNPFYNGLAVRTLLVGSRRKGWGMRSKPCRSIRADPKFRLRICSLAWGTFFWATTTWRSSGSKRRARRLQRTPTCFTTLPSPTPRKVT